MPVRNKADETYLRTKRSCTVCGVWQEEIKRVCGNGKREPHWPGKLGLWPVKSGCGPERSQIGLGRDWIRGRFAWPWATAWKPGTQVFGQSREMEKL